jgi:hypothetical protein
VHSRTHRIVQKDLKLFLYKIQMQRLMGEKDKYKGVYFLVHFCVL